MEHVKITFNTVSLTEFTNHSYIGWQGEWFSASAVKEIIF